MSLAGGFPPAAAGCGCLVPQAATCLALREVQRQEAVKRADMVNDLSTQIEPFQKWNSGVLDNSKETHPSPPLRHNPLFRPLRTV